MRPALATFLTLTACGAPPLTGSFDVRPVTLTPCGLAPELPTSVAQGAEVRVALKPSRSDASLRVVTIPAGAEAWLEGDVLVYRSGYETLAASAVVEVELTCGGKTEVTPIRLPVEATVKWSTPIRWAAADGPDPREHPQLIIDPASPDVLWLYGGFSFVPRQFTIVNDLWRMDLRTQRWERVDAMNAPMVAGGRFALGTRPGEFLLFGGESTSMDPTGEVYRLDVTATPARFERLPATGGPSTTLGALVHDTARHRLISFGGYTGSDVSSSVHTLALEVPNAAWARVDTGSGPSGRYGFFWAVDGDRLIVFSGGQVPDVGNSVNPAQDAWALDLVSMRWTRLAPPTSDAPGRRNGCGAVDASTHRFFVWSGTPNAVSAVDQLSVLSLGATPAWSRVSAGAAPTARGSCSAIFDAPRRRILFGFGNTGGERFADLQVLELGSASLTQ